MIAAQDYMKINSQEKKGTMTAILLLIDHYATKSIIVLEFKMLTLKVQNTTEICLHDNTGQPLTK